MEDIQFYYNNSPRLGELVLVQFTKHNDGFFEAKLLEYPFIGIMNYQDATKKRKISSWNKIVPLNKNMVARVDDINQEAKNVQLSIAYLSDEFKEEVQLNQIQNKLMIYFNENKIFYNFIKSLCLINNYKLETIWYSLIHYVDNLRNEYNTLQCDATKLTEDRQSHQQVSIWTFFNNNINNLENWGINANLDPNIIKTLQTLYNKRCKEVSHKIISKFGIISLIGISSIKILLDKILNNINYNYTLKYDASPYYIFETSMDDSTIDNHTELIQKIELEIKNQDLKIFIKIDYLGKIV
jgi:translation initiation factor 2 alpha subunit (eIF-2alpha)